MHVMVMRVGLLVLSLLVAAGTLAEESISSAVDPATGGCGTQIVYERSLRSRGQQLDLSYPACPSDGPCDDPVTRDVYLPATGSSVIVVRLAIHVVAHTDGSYPFATSEAVAAAIDSVNRHYVASRIRFEYMLDQVNSSEWRSLSEDEIDPMKIATAVDPTQFLNIWLTSVFFGYSFGTYPFEPDALEATGGIVLGQNHWGNNHAGLAHEIGHCFGLWHNFYGVSEVEACGPCYEAMDATDRDVLGDRCSDTPPAPAWYECSDAVGVDACCGLEWGVTQPENIMGYAPVDCRTMFTSQQQGRMRCWLNDILAGWIISQEPCCSGRVGDANGSSGDEPTVADVAIMVDAKFIAGTCLGMIPCIEEADINQSGGLDPICDDITMGDISTLIDYLFITGPELGLPECL